MFYIYSMTYFLNILIYLKKILQKKYEEPICNRENNKKAIDVDRIKLYVYKGYNKNVNNWMDLCYLEEVQKAVKYK